MRTLDSEIDASFYALIHRVAGEAVSAHDERRRNRRRPYPTRQCIAPCRTAEFPAAAAFQPVQCHDLHEAGFSFLLPQRPDFTTLVAVFESYPEPIYVSAEVAHCEEVEVSAVGEIDGSGSSLSNEHEGAGGMPTTTMVLVGCRFLERLHRPAE